MTSKSTVDAEKQVIRQVVEDAIGWALTKDLDLLYSRVAQDEDFFIFHPDSASTVVGFAAFKHMAETSWMNPAFKATHFEVKELRIRISASGDVAWYACFLDDLGEWNGREVGWRNARWTGTLEKRAGSWVHTQMHFSFPFDPPKGDAVTR